jgi:DNA polymerase-3 subunit epsilon
LNAACDPVTGEVLGILEEYVGQREPRMAAPELATRASGLTSSFLRGKSLDEDKVRNVLTRADCIVAHNAGFDRRMLTSLYPWAGNLKNWKCSLNDIKWETEVRMPETNLQALLAEHGIKTEEAHRARSDALGMLQLLSRRHAGKTLLAQLMGW